MTLQSMERMSAQDTMMFHLEDGSNPMHIGNVLLFEGPPPAFSDFADQVEAKLPRVPRYRQVAHDLPLHSARPVWIDDQDFSLARHVRRATLPPPGSREQLRRLASGVFSRRLDRRLPLWEMWFVDGLAGGGWAVVCKTHHALADGLAGTGILAVILDRERTPDPVPRRRWRPTPAPPEPALVAAAAGQAVAGEAAWLGAAARALRSPGHAAVDAARVSAGAVGWGRRLLRPSAQHLNAPIHAGRNWDWTGAPISDLLAVRRAFDATLNDVAMAAIAAGFREVMRARGEPLDRPVRSLMPVSVRDGHDADAVNNRVSAYFVDLPLTPADPVARLRLLQEQMGTLKSSRQAEAADFLIQATGAVPTPVQWLGCRVATHWPQASINTVTTNVPGPREPLYACGRRMLEGAPYVPLWGTIRESVAIFSYCDRVDFGVTADRGADDAGRLVAGIAAGLRELAAAAAVEAGRRPSAVAAPVAG